MKRVGLPRGLFYCYYYPLWKTFFEDLGAELISSPPTNHKTVEQGVDAAVDEACFPVKVYFGHVRALCAADLDYLFIPRMVSVEARSYICPKFMGMPDMIKAAIPNLPAFLTPVVDLSKNDRALEKEILRVGKLFVRRQRRITDAYQHGLEELHRCRQWAADGYTPTEAIEIWEGRTITLPEGGDLRIGLLGHGYSLYDRLISLNLVQRLREMGCCVHTVEMMAAEAVEQQAATMPKRIFWTLGRKNLGSALHMKEAQDIDGIIYLACFGCGPDSLVS
jgi:predicted nucleotide-binding protein (sugar kinase/HSP70/actin superfamily)